MDILIEVMEHVIEDLHGHVHRVSDLAVDLGTGLGLGDCWTGTEDREYG